MNDVELSAVSEVGDPDRSDAEIDEKEALRQSIERNEAVLREAVDDLTAAVKAGAQVKLGCDHTHYPAHVVIAPETLASLAGDLK